MSYFSYFPAGPDPDPWHLPKPVRAEPGRWPKLEAALAVVNRDVLATLPDQEALVLMSWEAAPEDTTEPEQVYVAMADGRWHGNAVNPYDPEPDEPREPEDPSTALASVADAAQETLVELRWQVWPVCWEHKLGMHVRPAGGGADAEGFEGSWFEGSREDSSGPPVWWCRGGRDGSHDVCLVGELAGSLPGKQRRELRREERRKPGPGDRQP